MDPHRVAVPVLDGMPLFEIGVAGEVFGMPRPDLLLRPYRVQVCAAGRRPVRTQGAAITLTADADFDEVRRAETVVVPALPSFDAAVPPELVDALQDAARRGARIASVCTGAFALAAAGLLDGRRATTHWMYAAALAEQYPAVEVDPAVLYVVDGSVATSAGTAAGLDLCLELLRHDHGTAVAAEVARRLIVPPHREGGQAQYVSTPLPDLPGSAIGPLLDWARSRLDRALTLRLLAQQAGVTTRTLSRRFAAEVGMPPLQWLTAERVRRARQLLESTTLPVEQVAEQCGLGTAANLRIHFARQTGVSPSAYRAAFAETGVCEGRPESSPAGRGDRQVG
ncbi:helix-turn-helix domain-containing protein [Microlunatus flavus]|uniref:AraC family transcriptional regulator, transcriptional activator FtrA n=1 Tax=Microlunatus flavus TaxID=1036181 RepID=A0A1H9FT19_9ACTN|nr:helix-turn-helix domain-containing protein [Microlunatus flavus]SEQ41037.1 AraC family transcriptional regulator, transcriptional activator FtrA [Microlunatus flavus]